MYDKLSKEMISKDILVVSDIDIDNIFNVFNIYTSIHPRFSNYHFVMLVLSQDYENLVLPENIYAVLIDEYSENAVKYFIKTKREIERRGLKIGHIGRYEYSAGNLGDRRDMLWLNWNVVPTPEYIKKFLDNWLEDIAVS